MCKINFQALLPFAFAGNTTYTCKGFLAQVGLAQIPDVVSYQRSMI